MTTHYVDIRLLPDPEFSQAHLLGALYSKLHRALVALDSVSIAASFPQYSLQPCTLGNVLRTHGSEAELRHLFATEWLRGMRDHVELGVLSGVPPQVQHRQLQRRQFKTSVERLRRRRMRRKGETLEQVVAAIPDEAQERPRLPYVRMRSSSTGQLFCLFLELGEPEVRAREGGFNAYGLSTTATVPWF